LPQKYNHKLSVGRENLLKTLSYEKAVRKMLMKLTPGADTINISGLLVEESRLLNPKKLGNLKN